MRRLATIAGVLSFVAVLNAPVEAAPVAVDEGSPTIVSSMVRLSSIGRTVLPAAGGFLAMSEADLGLTAVTFIPSQPTNPDSAPAEVIVLGEVAAQGDRLVAIDSAGVGAVEDGSVDDPQTPVVRLFRVPSGNGEFQETGYAVLPESVRSDVRRFGTDISIGGNAIAVVSETTSRSDRIDVFRVTPDGTAEWSQELLPRTLRTQVAISTSGATIAISGVNRLAASGELIVNRIGPSGWIPTQRFLRIGGGAVQMENDRIFVQRNSFFARSSGPWTVIDSLPGRPFEVRSELPVEGNSLAAGSGVVVVGDSANNLAYVLEEVGNELRFSQAIRPPRTGPTGESSAFGSSVAVLANQSLVVGAPGLGATNPAGEVFQFSLTDGPVGCTVVGSDGDDEITAPSSPDRQTVCGLGGNDIIVGASPDDVLIGGSGDDVLVGSTGGGTLNGGPGSDSCSQAGPATGTIITVDCEQ